MTDSPSSAETRRRSPRYVIVTPVRDEAPYIELTFESVVSQTLRPVLWVIVDDGSRDGTDKIVDGFAASHTWITVLHRSDRGYRSPGGGVDAFNAGYVAVTTDWDFLVNLDGDLSFEPDFFERSFGWFDADSQLGIGGGTVYRVERGRARVDSAGDPPFHVRGATKIYRRACWQDIGPLVASPGWDTIDEVRANLKGWHTRTFGDLVMTHHKPTGAGHSRWRNAFKNGQADYVTGYHPLYMFGKCMKRAFRTLIFFESTALLAGFLSGYLMVLPQQAGKDAVQYLRGQQIRRLMFRRSIYG